MGRALQCGQTYVQPFRSLVCRTHLPLLKNTLMSSSKSMLGSACCRLPWGATGGLWPPRTAYVGAWGTSS
ncbi:unnamed protein product [Ixodes hexagonus]